jgi:hypothetical protein
MATATYQFELAGLRGPAAALLAGGLVLSHLPAGVGLPCPLRTLTGIPCPFCGLTTSIRAACGGHLVTAAQAAPLGLVVLAAAIASLLGVLPRTLRLPRVLLLVTLAGEWVFELHRFHLL